MVIGLLPASGNAKRLGGLPKFSLPISENTSLLENHVILMREVCDEVRISTRSDWLRILENMNLDGATIIEHEPSTMLDALNALMKLGGEKFIVGMPDTFFIDYEKNPYVSLANAESDLALGLWTCDDNLRGKVGQVRTDSSGVVLEIIDKMPSCDFSEMWGAFKFSSINTLDMSLENPSLQFQKWIDEGEIIKSSKINGRYIDAGSFSGVKSLYTAL